ncbi:MAG: DUF1667 domain-containing protein [Longicatena sp.]
MKIELDCIVCPMSCRLEVTMNEKNEIEQVSGNSCVRGDVFARQESVCPMRKVSTTIRIKGTNHPLLPVITSQSVPKVKIFDIMKACKTLEVVAPISANQIIVKNIAGTEANLIASRSYQKENSFD